MQTKKKIIRSKNVEFILKSPDSIFIKRGNFCVAIMLIGLLFVSTFVQVPEYISSTINIYQTPDGKINNELVGKMSLAQSDLYKIDIDKVLSFHINDEENSLMKIKIRKIDDKIKNGDKNIIDIDLIYYGNSSKLFTNQSFFQCDGKLYIGETSFFKKAFEKLRTSKEL